MPSTTSPEVAELAPATHTLTTEEVKGMLRGAWQAGYNTHLIEFHEWVNNPVGPQPLGSSNPWA